MRERLAEFLAELTGCEEVRTDHHHPLMSSGLLDSLNAVELLLFIESDFGVDVSPSEIGVENFDSVERISSLVEAKQRA